MGSLDSLLKYFKAKEIISGGKPTSMEQKSIIDSADAIGKLGNLAKIYKISSLDTTKSQSRAEKLFGRGKISGGIGMAEQKLSEYAPNFFKGNTGLRDYESLKPTTAIALAKMDIGARPPKEAIRYYLDTLPDYNDRWDVFAGKIAGSILQASTREYATKTKKNINIDPQAQEEALNGVFNLLQNIMPEKEFNKFKNRWMLQNTKEK